MKLIVINLILGLVTAMEFHFLQEPPVDKVKGPAPMQAEKIPSPPAEIALPPLTHYAEIVERPLFNYDRLPHEDAVKDGADIDLLKLLGVVITPDRKEALFLSGSSKDVVHGIIGEEVEGWKIVSIQAGSVTLMRGGRTEEIKLERAPQPLSADESKKRTEQAKKKR